MGDHLVLSYDLPCAAKRAFMIYVDEIGSWWPGHVSADPSAFVGMRIEPWPGGRLYAVYRSGEEADWGVVSAIEPGRFLQHTLSLPHRSSSSTTVSVTFDDHDTGSRLTLSQTAWDGVDALGQTKFGEWPIILGGYVEAVRAAQRRPRAVG
jgi:Activator of Hsp90 ATPase homolog 1-like protein